MTHTRPNAVLVVLSLVFLGAAIAIVVPSTYPTFFEDVFRWRWWVLAGIVVVPLGVIGGTYLLFHVFVWFARR